MLRLAAPEAQSAATIREPDRAIACGIFNAVRALGC
jgi:hypothetical protein